MDFYFGKVSGNSTRAAFGLFESGCEFTPHVLDNKAGENRTPDYLAINPMGKIPSLVDGAFKLWESNAINWYAAEKNPSAHLLPDSLPGRADVQRWLMFQAAHVTPACIPIMRATHRRMTLRGRFGDLFRRVDALITPTVPVTAFAAGTIGVDEIDGRKIDRHLGWSPFTWPINLAGLPAATVPCGFDRDGLPIGLQIVAPWLAEETILSIAAAFEQARPWSGQWPALAA